MEGWRWLNEEARTCRKRQVCDECWGIISKGEQYKRLCGVTDAGRFEVYCFCPTCDTLHQLCYAADKEGVMITGMAEHLWEIDDADMIEAWNNNLRTREGCELRYLISREDP